MARREERERRVEERAGREREVVEKVEREEK